VRSRSREPRLTVLGQILDIRHFDILIGSFGKHGLNLDNPRDWPILACLDCLDYHPYSPEPGARVRLNGLERS